MEERERLQFELVGDPKDGGAVRADALYRFIQQVLQTLAAFQRDVAEGKRAHIDYRIVTLSYASPVRIALEPIPPEDLRQADIGPLVVQRFKRDVAAVSRGEEPEISPIILKQLEGLGAPFKNHVQSVSFGTPDERFELPRDIGVKAKRLLGSVYRSHGTFRGRLEIVNIHALPYVLNIFPPAGPDRVRCTWRASIEDVRQLLGRNVEAHGVLLFRGNDPHPYAIEAHTLLPLKTPDELPRVEQIIGTMPALPNGMDSTGYIRMLRDDEEDLH